jgi:hypothetical protein
MSLAPAMILLICVLAACVSIPTSEFNGYLNSFNSAKSSAQDFILQAKVAAETVANSSDNRRPNERVEKLNERRGALDARLAALDLISDFNNILVSLASGKRSEVWVEAPLPQVVTTAIIGVFGFIQKRLDSLYNWIARLLGAMILFDSQNKFCFDQGCA